MNNLQYFEDIQLNTNIFKNISVTYALYIHIIYGGEMDVEFSTTFRYMHKKLGLLT